MSNDIRIRSKVLARVDTDNFQPGSTASTLGYLMASSNTVSKMLPDAREVCVADYHPTVKPFLAGQATDNGRQLPNNLSWMAIRDNNGNLQFPNYEWKGAQIAVTTPGSFSPSEAPHIHLRVRLDICFRGRISTATVFHTEAITEPNDIPPPTYDVNGSFDDIRNGILTGALFPIGPEWNSINVANVGYDLNLDLTGFQFRDQSTMTVYTIELWENATQSYGANPSP